jgi:hypothetical protein
MHCQSFYCDLVLYSDLGTRPCTVPSVNTYNRRTPNSDSSNNNHDDDDDDDGDNNSNNNNNNNIDNLR